jgi:hypothetical protein
MKVYAINGSPRKKWNFDHEERKQRRIDVFPEDCRKASELGARLAGVAP